MYVLLLDTYILRMGYQVQIWVYFKKAGKWLLGERSLDPTQSQLLLVTMKYS